MKFPTILTGILSLALLGAGVPQQSTSVKFKAEPKVSVAVSSRSVATNLGGALESLVDQGAVRRDSESPNIAWLGLCRLYGLPADQADPIVTVTVWHDAPLSSSDVSSYGGTILASFSDSSIVNLKLSRVEEFAMSGANVVRLDIVPIRIFPDSKSASETAKVGPLPSGLRIGTTTNTVTSADPIVFEKSGASGAGTIVAVLDTGLDFRHREFLDENGKSRVLYLYDMSDNSYEESDGKIGSMPPFKIGEKYLGTLYTKEQLNSALAGTATVNSKDFVGHGTACTSIAAGSHKGVAPKADIIFVKIMQSSGAGEYIGPYYPSAAQWIKTIAKQRKMPVSMSMSFGSHYSNHDGSEADEQVIDGLLTTDAAGTSIAIAAGNEGRSSIQANSRFGKNATGQIDRMGDSVQTIIDGQEGSILAKFSAKDQWGVQIFPQNGNYATEDGTPVRIALNIFFDGESVQTQAVGVDDENIDAESLKAVAEDFNSNLTFSKVEDSYRLLLSLPRGQYWLTPFGYSDQVVVGTANFYGFGAVFGRGGSTAYLVGSPGNSLKAITVAAHIGVTRWDSQNGNQATNLTAGSSAPFSSPGPRTDGIQKPEISAPGLYMISALSRDSTSMGVGSDGPDKNVVSPDGKYLAWAGTSAATPFVAGVIALMFEKNPNLTSDEVKKILIETAKVDSQTSAVPNPVWGFGKVDGEKAVKAASKKPGVH